MTWGAPARETLKTAARQRELLRGPDKFETRCGTEDNGGIVFVTLVGANAHLLTNETSVHFPLVAGNAPTYDR